MSDAGRAAQWVQQLLAGMPGRRPPLQVHSDAAGRLVVVADRAVVLFGPFDAGRSGRPELGDRGVDPDGVRGRAGGRGVRAAPGHGQRAAHRVPPAGGGRGGQGVRPAGPAGRGRGRRDPRPAGPGLEPGPDRRQVRGHPAGDLPGPGPAPGPHQPGRRQSRSTDPGTACRWPAWTCPSRSTTTTSTTDGRDEPVDDDRSTTTWTTNLATTTGRRTNRRDGGDGADGRRDDARGAWTAPTTAADEAGRVGPGVAFGLGGAPRIETGSFGCRYAGAMLGYAYLDRAGVGRVWAGLAGAPWRRFDQGQIVTFTVLALLAGVGSVEQVKTLIPAQAGPLIGAPASPSLELLRPRLAAIADHSDVPGLQTGLAAAMLAMPGQGGGIFYVDDHFVPYAGGQAGGDGAQRQTRPVRARPGRHPDL